MSKRLSPLVTLLYQISLILAGLTALAVAQATEIPAPQDVAYPGTLELHVDATDLDRAIFRVHELIPVSGSSVTLLYPQWLPGEHGPNGPIGQFSGLVLSAGGKRVEWQRDPLNVYAFHVDLPPGTTMLDAHFEFLSPVVRSEGRITITHTIVGIQWIRLALYPAGYYVRRIPVSSYATLPDGWEFGGALEVAGRSGGEVHFKDTDLETLFDSPLFSGKYFKRFDLDPGAKVPVFLDVVADKPESLEAKPEALAAHRALVQQAYKTFGSHHYDHYDFLLAISDEFSGIGLEHHQSSENGVQPGYFVDWDKSEPGRDLLSHEYTHSWNGKFRRPFDLWTPNNNVPMQDTLLWVYEGQTQYWGLVLAARSGLLSAERAREALALTAAAMDHRNGRSWRSLQDTTNAPIAGGRERLAWLSWQRSADYYPESQLFWFEADEKIRELSKDRRSLNDFAKRFFGRNDGSHVTLTYTFEDVVADLTAVEPGVNWSAFLREHLDSHGPGAPLDGITRSGWHLVYGDKPSKYEKEQLERSHSHDFIYSLGFILDREDKIDTIQWDSPAFNAGLTIGAQLLAINGRSYKGEALEDAVTAAKTSGAPIELIFKKDDSYRTVRLDYHDGLKYPRLERNPEVIDRLDDIFAALR